LSRQRDTAEPQLRIRTLALIRSEPSRHHCPRNGLIPNSPRTRLTCSHSGGSSRRNRVSAVLDNPNCAAAPPRLHRAALSTSRTSATALGYSGFFGLMCSPGYCANHAGHGITHDIIRRHRDGETKRTHVGDGTCAVSPVGVRAPVSPSNLNSTSESEF